MKSIYLTLLCSLISFTAFGQVLTVGEEIILRSDTEYHLIGKLGGKVILFQDRASKHFVTAYDRRMQESWEKQLELRGRGTRIVDIIEHPRGFRLIYMYRDNGRNYLQMDSYDPAANLRDSTTLATFGYFANSPTYELVRSQDQSKALFIMAEGQQKLRAISIDVDSLRSMYDVAVDPEDFYFNENFLQAEISNEGDGYIILERDNFQSRRKDHLYEVLELSAAENRPASYELTMGDSLTYDVYFRYDNLNKKLVGTGLYSIRDLLRANGYFTIQVDPARNGAYNLQFQPFPQELIENLEGKKLRNKKNKGLDELSIRDAVLRRDGGFVLITERNRQLERRSAATQSQVLNSYSGRPLVDYYYDELIVFSVHPDGTPHWNNILHKKQYSQDDGGAFSSFLLLESPRRLRFLFNDEIRFENTVSEYVIDGKGEFDRNSLFHTRDLSLKLRFRDGVQVAANEVVIPSERRNRLRLVTLTY